MKEVYIIVIAIILDFVLGDPPNWPHPIRYIGWIIKRYENLIRKQKLINLKIGGFFLTGLSIITVTFIVGGILYLSKLIHPVVYYIVGTYLAYTSLATKCLDIETKKVYYAIKNNDIKKGRKMLSYLVGRDTETLTEKQVIRGAIETVAENTIDGVLAPTFYLILGLYLGVPIEMVFMYKTINTLDSMVGYIQKPYRDIGYASAKLDDMANFIPARLGSLIMLIAGIILRYDFNNGSKMLLRDRKNHKSPNCAYPESAVAGLLNIQLGGTNTYFGETLYKPTIGDDNVTLQNDHILKTIRIMYVSQILLGLLVLIVR
ncbi:adenosylcobinamide-phosphate synthase CbiB [Dethiothermospora halolimnae]|uniref:adenosylcobinamide-phosphate synthase CbiB n=1 Tax=Dethiothermospora halolimnae TaxID=3114390 RepID=UPI003CCC3044